jgi:hypothetical protein
VATYFTDDFADLGTDWTQRYNTGSSWSESGGNVAIPGASTSGDWNALTWNDVDSDADRDEVEILILWSIGTMGTQYLLVSRGSGADETPSHYSVRITASNIRTYKNTGADAPTQVASATKTFSAATDYWIRFRVNGTTIRVRAWADGGSEPGTWDCDSTDSAVTGVGWAGLAQFGPAAGGEVKQLGIGTNGDTAPDSAGSSVTGTLATTNANDTSAASGSTTIIGTVAYSNTNDTSAASGSTTIVGTLNTTNANDTTVATGAAGAITGTLAETNNNDTVAAAGVVPIVGTVSKTNANDTLSASGTSGTSYSATIKAGSWIRYRIIT